MPGPTSRSVHVDRVLTNISVAYQSQQNFVATRAFPVIGVQQQSNMFRQYLKSTFMRAAGAVRAPGTETVGIGYQTAMGRYFAPVYGLHHDIDDQTRANADPDMNLDRDATLLVTTALALMREQNWAANFFQTGVWATDVALTNQWSSSNSNPINDVVTERAIFKQRSGQTPNLFVIGPNVFTTLQNHPMIVDRIKYTSAQSVTLAMIGQLFGFNPGEIIVADSVIAPPTAGNTIIRPPQFGVYNSADDVNLSYIFGNSCLMLYVPPGNATQMVAAAGYTFSWSGYVPGASDGTAISSFYRRALKATRVEGEMSYSQQQVCADMGTFFPSVC